MQNDPRPPAHCILDGLIGRAGSAQPAHHPFSQHGKALAHALGVEAPPESGSGLGCGGDDGGLGWLAEKLDQGQDDQQQPGQHQDGLAGGLASEHQRQRGQDDGGDAQASLRVLLQHVSPIRRRSALNSRCGVAVQNGVGMYRNGRSGSV